MARSDWIEERRRRDAPRRAEMLGLQTATLEPSGRLVPPDVGFEIVRASVAQSGEMIALWARSMDISAFESSTTQPGWAVFPDSRTPTSTGAVVTLHGLQNGIATQITDLPVAHPLVQLLPQRGVLVVGARCQWTDAGAEHNALVYDDHGRLLIQGTLGDGIEHLRTTPSGQIWVGYSDEGVYGNYGWGPPNGPIPVGAPGIVSFTSDLERSWGFPSGDTSSCSIVDDCYALNADGETIWACYYHDFPVVRIRDGVVRAWTNEVRGATALAVSSDQVWLAGGYGPERDQLVTGTLRRDRLQVQATKRIVLPDESELPPGAAITGVGSRLHVVHGQDWFILDVEK